MKRMKNLYFAGCLAAAALLSVGLGACSSEEVVEDITSVEQQPDDAAALIDFGEFPAFGGGTRAAAVGKTGYEAGDKMIVSLYKASDDEDAIATCTFVYAVSEENSTGSWGVSSGSITQADLDKTNYWEVEFIQVHADNAIDGMYEHMICKSTDLTDGYTAGNSITVVLKRDYSRVRIHTGIPGLEVNLCQGMDSYTPPLCEYRNRTYFPAMTADANGDVIIYGSFVAASSIEASVSEVTDLPNYISYKNTVDKEMPDTKPNVSYLWNTDLGWMTLDADVASNSNSAETLMGIALFDKYYYWNIVSTTATELPCYFESNSVKVVDMSGASSITTIKDYCFRNSSLQSITLPENLKKIGDQAFKGCSSLSSITLGSTVTLMGINAFQNCTSLETVTLDGVMSHVLGSFSDNVFSGCTGLKQIVCYISKDDSEDYAIQDYSRYLSNLFNITNTEGNLPTIYVSDGYEGLVGKTVGDSFTVKSIDEYTE
jgi:hypothetical protein